MLSRATVRANVALVFGPDVTFGDEEPYAMKRGMKRMKKKGEKMRIVQTKHQILKDKAVNRS